MTVAVEKIVSEVLELPPAVRAFVAEKLIESLDTASAGELSTQWREEIRRRCAEIDQGSVELRDAESVFAKAYSALA
jgi:putative addiction module component (TIGR02574 family)